MGHFKKKHLSRTLLKYRIPCYFWHLDVTVQALSIFVTYIAFGVHLIVCIDFSFSSAGQPPVFDTVCSTVAASLIILLYYTSSLFAGRF